MRKMFALILVLALCLTAVGCRSAMAPLPSGNDAGQTPGTTGTAEDTTSPSLPQDGEEIEGTDMVFGNVGTQRISYTGIVSSVEYITSPAQLPAGETFSKYDEAYFREHALVLVTDTVGSGSIRVGIEGILLSRDTAYVKVSRELPGDAGTADMATWLIWIEVDAGLTCQWRVLNPAYRPSGDDHVDK